MAFGFIKKVFSFGRKEVVEERPDQKAPLPAPETGTDIAPEALALAPAPQPLPEEPAPAPTPAEPEPAEPVPSVPEVPATPEVPAEPEEVPAPAPAEVPAPSTPQEVPTEPQDVPEPLPEAEQVAPPFPSPSRGGSADAVDRGGVSGSPDATEAITVADAPLAPEAPVVAEAPAAAEMTPSSPADHRPLKGGEAVAPAPKPAAGKVTVAKKVEQRAEPKEAPAPAAPKRSWFQRMREGLSRSSRELSGNIAGVFTKRKLDEDTLQDLEDVLIRADLGVETALRVTDALSASRYGKDVSDAEVREVMAAEVEKVLKPVALPLELDLSHKPHVVLVVGVNGTGKTTTIGKLAAKLTAGGLSVMLAAGDTFRAAAIEQLKIWGERTGSPVVATKLGADAAGLAYDAFEKAKAAGSDVLIIDTAGRLQNKAELMDELEKIVRVLGKLDPEAPHTVLQTVDATTGQNALNQVEIFRNVAGVNGLVMTKLDGTARGGILVAIAAKHRLPVYFIGVGEQVDDLEPFSAGEFAKAIAGVA
ncbi:signal recognition particle-docking protein FtsY [Mesorhizobium sp. PUT5]|uniref:signal recognition particle-docking protein FtsY n=1 Tax=Mesorhizobium sp. PUT5 TaxID=3454629 RepID=UPI003FA4C062